MSGFSRALGAAMCGAMIRREGWPQGHYVMKRHPGKHSDMTDRYLYYDDGDRTYPWTPSQQDLFAEDWMP